MAPLTRVCRLALRAGGEGQREEQVTQHTDQPMGCTEGANIHQACHLYHPPLWQILIINQVLLPAGLGPAFRILNRDFHLESISVGT